MLQYSFVFVMTVALTACVPAPKKAYSPAEITGINSLTEIMRVQAQKADPLFGKRAQSSFTDAEFTEMVSVAEILEATATQLDSKFTGSGEYDDGFGEFAKQLNANAKALGAAGAAKDAAAAGKALVAMKTTCASCHGVYK